MTNLQSLTYYLPEMFLVGIILLAILIDLIPVLRRFQFHFTIIGLFSVGVLLLNNSGSNTSLFMNMIAIDPFSHFFKWIFLTTTIVIIFISRYTLEMKRVKLGEFNVLLMIVMFGLFLMASATNLVMIYLSIETVSIGSYVLAGMLKGDRQSNEASLKYVIFGAFASGLMLYGFSWLYGISGSTNLSDIGAVLQSGDHSFVILLAVIMVIAGIGYKISMVPFHYWTPDVYQGAPTPVTAFLSVAPKAAGFALFLRFFYITFTKSHYTTLIPVSDVNWPLLIAILSAATMTVGNLIALKQDNVKRLLAYSSIAHAGYMLMAVPVMTDSSAQAIMLYMVMYLFMNLAAFFVVIYAANSMNAHSVDEYKGMGKRAPLVGVIMTFLLLSLTGLPPTAGFIGKFYLFAAVIESNRFYWLAVIGILNSVVSLFYYFRIVRSMYFEPGDDSEPATREVPVLWCIIIFALPVLILGIYWSPLYTIVENSFSIFGLN